MWSLFRRWILNDNQVGDPPSPTIAAKHQPNGPLRSPGKCSRSPGGTTFRRVHARSPSVDTSFIVANSNFWTRHLNHSMKDYISSVTRNTGDVLTQSSILRSTWIQIVLVSIIVTLSRGTLNALNAIGGLGTGDVKTATMVNLLSSISFSAFSWLSGGIVNFLGYRTSVCLGALCTTATLTCLMLYAMYHVIPAFPVMIAASFDGIGSGILWTAAGTVLIKFPSDENKGFASTILFAIYSFGAAMGGLISFAMNINTVQLTPMVLPGGGIPLDGMPLEPVFSSGLKPASFSVMIALAATGFILSLFVVRNECQLSDREKDPPDLCEIEFLASPIPRVSPTNLPLQKFRLFTTHNSDGQSRHEQDQNSRDNNRSPLSVAHTPFKPQQPTIRKVSFAYAQFNQLTESVMQRSVQLLIIYSFASLFHQTYLFNGINYRTFNVRTRGLNCFMYWLGRVPAGFIHGQLVDDMRFPSRSRALHGFSLLLFYVGTCQCLTVIFWAIVPAGSSFDVALDPAHTALAFASFFLYGGLDTVSQSFGNNMTSLGFSSSVLWIFSCLGKRFPSRVPHYVAIFRCFQGLGSSLAWALDLNSFASYQTQFLICVICWSLAIPGLMWVIFTLPKDDVGDFLPVKFSPYTPSPKISR